MADEDWILDGIINLLSGPIWSIPILSYIEQKSVTFEQADEAAEEAEEVDEEVEVDEEEVDEVDEKKMAFKEYKKLVNFLLHSFMADLGITSEDLEAACENASVSTPFHQSLLEQIFAADSFKIFTAMMTRHNIELQIQAIEMLKFKYGVDMSRDSEANMAADEHDLERREREILDQVYRISREEFETLEIETDQEQKNLELAIANSKLDEKLRLEKSLIRPIKKEEEEEEEEEEEIEEIEEEITRFKKQSIDEEDLKRRQEYLKAQRDKLLDLKQSERRKVLEDLEERQERPKSSYAARKAMEGGRIDPRTLAVRRALAQRLKAEVIKED